MLAVCTRVLLTAEASISRWAGAGKGGHVVCAGARATGAAQTLVHVEGTAGTSKAREAGARKGAHAILAGATIQAGVWGPKGEGLVIHLAPYQPNLTQPCLSQRGIGRKSSLTLRGTSGQRDQILSPLWLHSSLIWKPHLCAKKRGMGEPKGLFELPSTCC
uniref:Uncharacterized protein n=1 Tax=Suricata suricatta TaxID=37032 RepID=A0A673TEX8_SURSU